MLVTPNPTVKLAHLFCGRSLLACSKSRYPPLASSSTPPPSPSLIVTNIVIPLQDNRNNHNNHPQSLALFSPQWLYTHLAQMGLSKLAPGFYHAAETATVDATPAPGLSLLPVSGCLRRRRSIQVRRSSICAILDLLTFFFFLPKGVP